MKRYYYYSVIFLALLLCIGKGHAQSDVTNLVLKNAGFDESINFTVDGEVVNWRTSANNDPVNWGMHELEGWNPYTTADPTGCGATFEYGAPSMINDVTPPLTAYDGTANGGALGFSAGWGTQVAYRQNVNLPAGSYTISYVFYNRHTNVNGTSLTGWMPDEGNTVLSTVTTFPTEEWATDAISFDLAASATGKIQVGLGSIEGSGSGAVAKLFIDWVKLTCNSINKTELAKLITEANALVATGGTKAPELSAAIDAVNAVLSQAETSAALINAAIGLSKAVLEYKATDYQEEFLAQAKIELEALLIQAEELIRDDNPNEYPRTTLYALESAYTEASEAFDNDALTYDNVQGYIDRLLLAINNYKASALGLKIHYTFDNVTGKTVTNAAGQEYNGTLFNEASVIPMGKYKVLSLGNGTGYLDMGALAGNIVSSMENFTISVYYRVDKNASLSGNGYFLWTFSVLEANSATQDKYLAYRLNAQKFALATGGYNNEQAIDLATAATQDVWQHVLYRQTGSVGELYINGLPVGINEEIPIPNATFTTPPAYNWIGRAAFTGDNYLKNTLVYDFRFYNQAVDDIQIAEWAALTTELENEYQFGTKGDFSKLTALIAECNALLATITTGDEPGQFPETAVWELTDAIAAAQAIVTENKASQFVIDSQITALKTAYDTFLGTINPETNTLAEGEYYIKVAGVYLNNPGKDNLADKIAPSVANTGLQATRNILDESQIYNVVKESVDDTNPEIFRYSIASIVNEADSIDDPVPYRYLTDNAQYEKWPIYLNWWTFDISYNAVADAHSIYVGGDGTVRGYLRYLEAEQRLANQNGITATPVYVFKFITVKTVFDEEVAAGRAVFDAATVGTAANEYSQSVYDAFKTALETADAITADAFTNEDLFEYGAARKLFVRNDGSSEFTGIAKVKPAQSDISIAGGDKQIRIVTGKAANATVYSITGAIVTQKVLSAGESFVPVSPGLYIVKVSGQTSKAHKVIVR
ncbi:MAG: T9SS type A sorting domain-containing protein [Dysgonamonadaceae bacterium]|jgi:hypothetical protein|nr:T9SS type A sorting domain-containing protein [Dysgonamonadaceae bacterium]